jgi:hypothetical protein
MNEATKLEIILDMAEIFKADVNRVKAIYNKTMRKDYVRNIEDGLNLTERYLRSKYGNKGSAMLNYYVERDKEIFM